MPSEVICILPKEKEAQAMEITTTASNRKETAKAIAELTGERAVYLGPPTFAYQIGSFLIDRDGIIRTDDEEQGEEVRAMLEEHGNTPTEETGAETSATSIKLPIDGMTPLGITNLMNMLHSKQYLLNKAVGAERFKVSDALITSLGNTQFATTEEAVSHIMGTADYGEGFSFEDGCIVFSGFPYSTDAVRVKAYCELAAAMVRMAGEQKRIKPDQTIEENEKYFMRVWLVRLGFDGKEAKETRRVLLEKLKGHTAFRTDADRVKWQEAQARRKAAASGSGVE